MKKIIPTVLIFIFIVTNSYGIAIPVVDYGAIAAEVIGFKAELKKWTSYIGLFTDFKDNFNKKLESFLIKSAGLDPNDIDEFMSTKDDILTIYENSSYYLDELGKEIWGSLLIEFNSVKTKYPSIAPEYVNRAEKTEYYKTNTEYKEYIDENKRIYKEEVIKDLDERIVLLRDLRKMADARKERIELFYEKYKEFSKTKKTADGEAMQQGKLIALNNQINFESIYQHRDINLLLRSFLETKTKNFTWQLDNKRRRIKLNKDNSKNIENTLKMGEN